MKSSSKNLLFNLFSVIILAALPLVFGWDFVKTDLMIGKFIDFTVPENLRAAHSLVWNATSTWSNSINGGNRNTFAATVILQNLILYGPIYLFDSTWVLGKWCLLFPLSVSGISYFIFFSHFGTYYRKNHFNGKKIISILEAFTLSILFTFTNFNYNEISYGSSNYVFSCALLPMALAFFHMACLENKIGLLSLLSLGLAMIAGGVLQNLVVLITFSFVIAYFHKIEVRYLFKYCALFLFLSIFWVIPVVLGAPDIINNQLSINYPSGNYQLYDVITNRIYTAVGGRLHYELTLPPFLSLSYAIASGFFLLIPIYLIFTNIKGQASKFTSEFATLALLLIIVLFLIKGSGVPFGEVNTYLFTNVPAASLFRTINRFWPFYYLCLAFMYAALSEFPRRKFILSFFIVSICSPWYLSRDFGMSEISRKAPNLPRVNMYPPAERSSKFHQIINENEDFRILTSPMSASVQFLDDSGNRVSQGGDADLILSGKAFYSTDGIQKSTNLLSQLEYQMYTNSGFLVDNQYLFKSLGIKYFIVKKDTATEFSLNRPYANRSPNYQEQNGIVTKVHSDDECDVFEFVDYLPTVYTLKDPAKLEILWGRVSSYVTFRYDDFYPPKSLQQKWASKGITYNKISDSIYNFKTDEVTGIFPIFLNVNFDEDWILIPDPASIKLDFLMQILLQPTNDNISHFRGPLSTNGWAVNSEKLCFGVITCERVSAGSYKFEGLILFKPQMFLIVGAVFSFTVFFLIFLFSFCRIALARVRPVK
jgi:hypothetical protein